MRSEDLKQRLKKILSDLQRGIITQKQASKRFADLAPLLRSGKRTGGTVRRVLNSSIYQ